MASAGRYFLLFLFLLGGWFILSDQATKPFFFIAGLVCCLLVLWLCRRMAIVDGEGQPLHLAPRAFLYGPWLLKEMFLSSARVAKRVLEPNMNISPAFQWIESRQRNAAGHVVYANSITLTPGTVSVDAEEHPDGTARLYIHALEHTSLESLRQGGMGAKVRALMGGGE